MDAFRSYPVKTCPPNIFFLESGEHLRAVKAVLVSLNEIAVRPLVVTRGIVPIAPQRRPKTNHPKTSAAEFGACVLVVGGRALLEQSNHDFKLILGEAQSRVERVKERRGKKDLPLRRQIREAGKQVELRLLEAPLFRNRFALIVAKRSEVPAYSKLLMKTSVKTVLLWDPGCPCVPKSLVEDVDALKCPITPGDIPEGMASMKHERAAGEYDISSPLSAAAINQCTASPHSSCST